MEQYTVGLRALNNYISWLQIHIHWLKTSFLCWIGDWCHILASSQNDQGLTLSLSKLIDLILLPEVDLVDWLFDLALEVVLEWWNLIVLGECVAWREVLGQADAELIVSVEVDLFLQLTADVLIVICMWSQMLIKLIIDDLLASIFKGLSLLWLLQLHGLSDNLVLVILVVDLLTLLVELDDQIVLLGIREPNIISLHFV